MTCLSHVLARYLKALRHEATTSILLLLACVCAQPVDKLLLNILYALLAPLELLEIKLAVLVGEVLLL